MATFTQGADPRATPARYALDPQGAIAPPPGPPPLFPADGLGRSDAQSAGTLTLSSDNKPSGTPVTFPGERVFQSTGGFDFFETFHVVQRSFQLGNLLAGQSIPFEVFSGYRRTAEEWTSYVSNAGAGVDVSGLPALPTNVLPLNAVPLVLEVSTSGAPFVDDTLDFTFALVGTIEVPIVITRIVLWWARPEVQFRETLAFLTEVFRSKDGTERRESKRKNGRQVWAFDYQVDEGLPARILENLLFDYHGRAFGVPTWYDDTVLTAPAAIGETTITVESTLLRDFRDEGLAIVLGYTDGTFRPPFDVVQISPGGVGATTLTFDNPLTNNHVVGTEVFPLSMCRLRLNMPGERYAVNLRRARMEFTAMDNDADLADLSGFSSYNGKLLLDVGNSMLGQTVGHAYEQQAVRMDGGAGLVYLEADEDRSRRGHRFTMRAYGREAVWDMRNMLRALRGRQVSLYVPTDADDLEVVDDLGSGGVTMDIENVGYAQFIRNRAPKNVIRISFVDGSPPLLRTIIGSTEIDPVTEQLTVDVAWPSTVTPAEIARVEYVEKVRLDSDSPEIEFHPSGTRAYLRTPFVAVFE